MFGVLEIDDNRVTTYSVRMAVADHLTTFSPQKDSLLNAKV